MINALGHSMRLDPPWPWLGFVWFAQFVMRMPLLLPLILLYLILQMLLVLQVMYRLQRARNIWVAVTFPKGVR